MEKEFDENDLLVSESVGSPELGLYEALQTQFLEDINITGVGSPYLYENSAESLEGDYGYRVISIIEEPEFETVSMTDRINELREKGVDESYIDGIYESSNAYSVISEDEAISDDTRIYLSNLDASDLVNVSIVMDYQTELDIPRVNLDISGHLPMFSMNAEMERITKIQQRATLFQNEQASIVEYIENNGGEVDEQLWVVNGISAIVSVEMAYELSNRVDVRRLMINTAPETTDVYFEEARNVTQTEYFRVPHGGSVYQGDRKSYRSECEDILVAVIDPDYFNEQHFALREMGAGQPRVYETYDCSSGNCISGQLNSSATGDHGTRMVGILTQDLYDAQDPYYLSNTDRLRRSGIASEASVILINSDGYIANEIQAAILENVDFISASIGNKGVGRDCNGDGDIGIGGDACELQCPDLDRARGQDLVSLAVNDAFNAGIFTVTSAGNNGDSCCCNNQVLAPGSGPTTFCVGAYEANDDDPITDFDTTGLIKSYSAKGPTLDGRRKPDIAAPTNLLYVMEEDPNYLYGPNAYAGGSHSSGTSSATPVVAGAAVNFKDWFIEKFGYVQANNPGMIFVNMLNFGDRKNVSTSGRTVFDVKYGAGRLRMRLPNQEGMDAPWRWATGQVTMEDGDVVTRYMGPALMPWTPINDDVNLMKLALWWPEYNVGAGQTNAMISVDLCRYDNGNWICDTHTSNGDQKIHFIYDDNESNFSYFAGGLPYKFRINADNIPDGETRTVYWSYFWEDLDRDDATNGPCYSCGYGDPDYLFYR